MAANNIHSLYQYLGLGNYAEAAKIAREIIRIGKKKNKVDSNALFYLGLLYYNGLGVKQDHSKAVKLWIEAAKRNNKLAINGLGICYEKGYGIEQSDKKAWTCFKKANEHAKKQAEEKKENL